MNPFQCQFLLDISERNPEGILMNIVISPKSAKMPVAVKAIDVYTFFNSALLFLNYSFEFLANFSLVLSVKVLFIKKSVLMIN